MSDELQKEDFDILQAIAESEGLATKADSKEELADRIIDHRQRIKDIEQEEEQWEDEIRDSPLHGEDIEVVQGLLISEKFNPHLVKEVSQERLIGIYMGYLKLKQLTRKDLIEVRNGIAEELRPSMGRRVAAPSMAVRPGGLRQQAHPPHYPNPLLTGEDDSKEQILAKLRTLAVRTAAEQESKARGKIQESARIREALATLPGPTYRRQPDGTFAILDDSDGIFNASAAGGGAAKAPSPRGRPPVNFPYRHSRSRSRSPGGGAGIQPSDNERYIIATLTDMNIPADIAKQAALRGSSVEAVLGWALNQ